MTTGAVNNVGSGAGTTATGQRDPYAALSSTEFVRIMFAELQNQDPLKPNDSNALLQQLSNIRSIQSDLELSSRLSEIVQQNQLASASALIGKSVSGLTDNNQRVTGVVALVNQTKDGPVVQLRTGERLAFNNIDQITEAPGQTPGPGGPTTPPNPPGPSTPTPPVTRVVNVPAGTAPTVLPLRPTFPGATPLGPRTVTPGFPSGGRTGGIGGVAGLGPS